MEQQVLYYGSYELLFADNWSEMWDVSTDTLYAMVQDKQIPYVRIRRRILFHKDVIEDWVRGVRTLRGEG